MDHEALIRLALDEGAAKATVLDVDDIVTSPKFRDVCISNSCGSSGRCWMCPPDAGEADELIAKVRAYKKALIFQTITELEDSFDFETMGEAGSNIAKLCRVMRKKAPALLGDGILVLGAGGCHGCERCTRIDNEPCRDPENALLSLEACCVDVYNTVKPTDLKYINGPDTVTYFGMVLFN